VEQVKGSAYSAVLYGPAGRKLALMTGHSVVQAFVLLSARPTASHQDPIPGWYRRPDWLEARRGSPRRPPKATRRRSVLPLRRDHPGARVGAAAGLARPGAGGRAAHPAGRGTEPTLVQARRNLALVLEDQGRREEASASLERAIQATGPRPEYRDLARELGAPGIQ
jgi:hypothetical protein